MTNEVVTASGPLIRRLADSVDANSFANRLRAARFRKFEALVADLPRPMRVLDVGGTNKFWENRGWANRADIQIFSLNIAAETKTYENIHPIAGDASDLSQFGDRSFDVVFSNSVIEHLRTSENQGRMASEIRRVGKAFWVQTPNFWFPMEPHFHIPGWQWMPVAFRVALLRRRRCGWAGPCPDPVEARKFVEEVQLLTQNELKKLFPGATLIPERFAGLVKSWTAIDGFPEQSVSKITRGQG